MNRVFQNTHILVCKIHSGYVTNLKWWQSITLVYSITMSYVWFRFEVNASCRSQEISFFLQFTERRVKNRSDRWSVRNFANLHFLSRSPTSENFNSIWLVEADIWKLMTSAMMSSCNDQLFFKRSLSKFGAHLLSFINKILVFQDLEEFLYQGKVSIPLPSIPNFLTG